MWRHSSIRAMFDGRLPSWARALPRDVAFQGFRPSSNPHCFCFTVHRDRPIPKPPARDAENHECHGMLFV